MTKLNLACGDDIRDGYLNMDLYNPKAQMKCDVLKVPFEDNIADEILAYHIIEHFDVLTADNALAEWYRLLSPGGIFKIETPDLWSSCKAFLEWPKEFRPFLYGHMFAKAWMPGETHKFLYIQEELTNKMINVGFKNIIRTAPDSSYFNARNKWNPELYLHLTATKEIVFRGVKKIE
jgi:predicted SAM-dependent methyltransferase